MKYTPEIHTPNFDKKNQSIVVSGLELTPRQKILFKDTVIDPLEDIMRNYRNYENAWDKSFLEERKHIEDTFSIDNFKTILNSEVPCQRYQEDIKNFFRNISMSKKLNKAKSADQSMFVQDLGYAMISHLIDTKGGSAFSSPDDYEYLINVAGENLSLELKKDLAKLALSQLDLENISQNLIRYSQTLNFIDKYLPKVGLYAHLKNLLEQSLLEKDFEILEKFIRSNFLLKKRAITLLNNYLSEEFEISPLFIEKSWGLRSHNLKTNSEAYNSDISKNIFVMEKIEAKRPGIVKALCEKFGIKEFQRYI